MTYVMEACVFTQYIYICATVFVCVLILLSLLLLLDFPVIPNRFITCFFFTYSPLRNFSCVRDSFTVLYHIYHMNFIEFTLKNFECKVELKRKSLTTEEQRRE